MSDSQKIVPIGSECYVNGGLDNSKLLRYKLYKSPFNGMRLLDNMHLPPVLLFFTDMRLFRDLYCNECNWILHDDVDMNAYNNVLNIRRCHIKKDNPFDFINKCYKTISLLEQDEYSYYYLLDLNDYIIYDRSILELIHQKISRYNVLTFIRHKNIHASLQSILNVRPLQTRFNIDKNYSDIINIFNPIILNDDYDGIKSYNNFYNNNDINSLISLFNKKHHDTQKTL